MNLILQAIKSLFRSVESKAKRAQIAADNAKVTADNAKVTADKAQEMALAAATLTVHVSYADEEYTADATYSEISEAVRSGRRVIVEYTNNTTPSHLFYAGQYTNSLGYNCHGFTSLGHTSSYYCQDVLYISEVNGGRWGFESIRYTKPET